MPFVTLGFAVAYRRPGFAQLFINGAIRDTFKETEGDLDPYLDGRIVQIAEEISLDAAEDLLE